MQRVQLNLKTAAIRSLTWENFRHTLVQRHCRDVSEWSAHTYWAPWPLAEASSPWATPRPSSSLYTHLHKAWQCPLQGGGWGHNTVPPWSTSPSNQTILINLYWCFKLWFIYYFAAFHYITYYSTMSYCTILSKLMLFYKHLQSVIIPYFWVSQSALWQRDNHKQFNTS